MNNNYIALLDSGVGGISLLIELVKAMPNENFIYLGDNGYAPYGNRSKNDLLTRTLRNVDLLKSNDIKALALACNTLSVALRERIEYYSGLKTYGVYPPVESCVTADKRNVLLLCTPLTATTLSKHYNNKFNNLKILGLPSLAQEIEKNKYNLESIDLKRVVNVPKGQFNRVILGCTHYCLIKNKIYDHLKPQIIVSGNTYTVDYIKKDMARSNSLGNNKRNEILFVGEYGVENEKFYRQVVKK